MEEEIKETKKPQKKSEIGRDSLICCLIFLAVAAFIAITSAYIVFIVFPLLAIIPFGLFVASVTCGFISIFEKNRNTKSMVEGIISLSLIFGSIIILIILFSTGSLVIRFM